MMWDLFKKANNWYDGLKEPYRFFLFMGIFVPAIWAVQSDGVVLPTISMVVIFGLSIPRIIYLCKRK